MKSITGFTDNDDEEEGGVREQIDINYDWTLTGAIEVVVGRVTPTGVEKIKIEIPGEMVGRFVNAYLHGRKIESINLFPQGYLPGYDGEAENKDEKG